MGKISFYLTLILARFIYILIKILNKSSATSFIGMVALKLCPKFLTYCADYVKTTITITGTNGKTTSSGLLAHIIESNNNKVIHNVKGANMLTGVANVFALNIIPANIFDFAIIESDEAYLNKLYDDYLANYLIVTNLFKDQVDRYADISTTASLIQKAIDKNPNVNLLLNADDPTVSRFGTGKKALYYGFEDVEYCYQLNQPESQRVIDEFSCNCGENLVYTKQILAQEGHYNCPSCGFARPEPDFKGYAKIYADCSEIKVLYKNQEFNFKVNLIGLYNAYNALAAISQALLLDISVDVINSALNSYKTMLGRSEKTVINGHDTLIQLIKNPAGANEVLKTVDLESNILIAINDNIADGRDISWLNDTNFEVLKDANKLIVASGLRAKDVAKRLESAGIDVNRITIEEDIKKAIELVTCSQDSTPVTILPSYTVLLKIGKIKF